jgi:AraC family transcriptional regulator, regulatory protein of adaptative response / methylated-DNA-[protein]-cysteine methyltransferase
MNGNQFFSGNEVRYWVGEGALGLVLVAQSARGVCAILIGQERDALVKELQKRFPAAQPGEEPGLERIMRFVEAPQRGLDLELDVRGSPFQQRVWVGLRQIPAGQTVSYTELARRIGLPRSVRAVARACAANTLAVVIPCHRVVRSDGGLSGYRWGVERKRALLESESA